MPKSSCNAGETALGLAAGGGQLEVVRLLIKEGADVQMATGSNPKPLHRAAAIGEGNLQRAVVDNTKEWCKSQGQSDDIVLI